MSEKKNFVSNEKKRKKVFKNSRYFGFAAYVRTEAGNWKLRLNWKRIFILGVSFFLVAYFGFAYVRYANDKYRKEVESTSYWTMLIYPFSREARLEHRKAVGDAYIERAKQAKTPGEVIANVRTGLSYSPMNPDGRIYYSYLMFHQRMVKDAVKLLAEGVPAALEHKEYIIYFVRRCLETAEDDLLVKIAEEELPKMDALLAEIENSLKNPGVSDDVRANLEARKKQVESNKMLLSVGTVQSLILRGRFDLATERMEAYQLRKTLTGQVLAVQILWESGEHEKALALLNEVVQASNGNTQVVLLRAHYLSTLGENSRALTGLIQAAVADENPEIRIRIISLTDSVTQKAQRERRIAEYVRRYENNATAMFMLAQHAADKNDFELVERLYKIAEEKIYENITRFEMVYIETLIANNKAKEALDLLKKLSEESIGWVEQNSATINCLRTFAYYKNGDESLGRLSLENTLKNRTVSVSQLILIGRRLTEMGLLDEGRSAYEAAYLAENYNHKALIALVDYAIEKKDVGVLFRYLPELLDTRRPPRQTLERIQRFLGSDRMLFIAERDDYLKRVSDLLERPGGTRTSDDSLQTVL